jgi:hypothetical protein
MDQRYIQETCRLLIDPPLSSVNPLGQLTQQASPAAQSWLWWWSRPPCPWRRPPPSRAAPPWPPRPPWPPGKRGVGQRRGSEIQTATSCVTVAVRQAGGALAQGDRRPQLLGRQNSQSLYISPQNPLPLETAAQPSGRHHLEGQHGGALLPQHGAQRHGAGGGGGPAGLWSVGGLERSGSAVHRGKHAGW